MDTGRPSRLESRAAARRRTKAITYTLVAVGAAAVMVGTLVAVSALRAAEAGPPPSVEETVSVPPLEATSTLEAAAPATMVEVPDLLGKPADEAEMLLSYAGFVPVTREATDLAGDAEPGTVVAQDPGPGRTVSEGATVTLLVAPESPAPAQASPAEHFVVVIDPGHQARSNLDQEPIGPGSSVTKDKVRGGATGVETRIPEYETVLRISLLVKEMLEAEGVEVVMTRTENDVDISNRERALVANEAGADLFVRVHCDGAGDEDANGVSTLYPSGNSWVAPIEERSRAAAEIVQAAVVESTGATDRGVVGRDDITGFNWSKVPAVLIECGFLSNPIEDRLLASDGYRKKVARGIADGVLGYLESR
ncbi:MAG: hypothetical protein Kow0056_03680 [Coriobacteriia bacterium]